MNKYLKHFLITRSNHHFADALKSTLQLYIDENLLAESNTELKQEIEQFKEHISKSPIGAFFENYSFKVPLPEDLLSFLTDVRGIESLNNTKLPLIEEAKNIIASKKHLDPEKDGTTKAIFEQTACLERALIDKTVPIEQIPIIENQIKEWIAELYDHFAFMILKAHSLEELFREFDLKFNKEISYPLPNLNEFGAKAFSQIEQLEQKGFFKLFYSLPSLSKKYEFITQLSASFNDSVPFYSTELHATLLCLKAQIFKMAYIPYKTKMFHLMDQRVTLEVLSENIKEWAEYHIPTLKSEPSSHLEWILNDFVKIDLTEAEKTWVINATPSLKSKLINHLEKKLRNLKASEIFENSLAVLSNRSKPPIRCAYEIYCARLELKRIGIRISSMPSNTEPDVSGLSKRLENAM